MHHHGAQLAWQMCKKVMTESVAVVHNSQKMTKNGQNESKRGERSRINQWENLL
jgi:hypothetical protein